MGREHTDCFPRIQVIMDRRIGHTMYDAPTLHDTRRLRSSWRQAKRRLQPETRAGESG